MLLSILNLCDDTKLIDIFVNCSDDFQNGSGAGDQRRSTLTASYHIKSVRRGEK